MLKAILPLSADPLTLGHMQLIERASELSQQLLVAVLHNNTKDPLFNLNERERLVNEAIACNPKLTHATISITSYNGLLATLANEVGIYTIFRGVRNAEDWNYEGQLEQGHLQQHGGEALRFVYLRAKPGTATISASIVRSIFRARGNVSELVPLVVKRRMEEKVFQQYKVIVTGATASGKSAVCQWLSLALKPQLKNFSQLGIDAGVHHIDFDKVVNHIYSQLENGGLLALQKQMVERLGVKPNTKGSISKKDVKQWLKRGNDSKTTKALLVELQKLLAPHIHNHYLETINTLRGILVLEMPMAVEYRWLGEANNCVVLVSSNAENQQKRLLKRGHSREKSQLLSMLAGTSEEKRSAINAEITTSGYGKLIEFNNNRNASYESDGVSLVSPLAKQLTTLLFDHR